MDRSMDKDSYIHRHRALEYIHRQRALEVEKAIEKNDTAVLETYKYTKIENERRTIAPVAYHAFCLGHVFAALEISDNTVNAAVVFQELAPFSRLKLKQVAKLCLYKKNKEDVSHAASDIGRALLSSQHSAIYAHWTFLFSILVILLFF